MEPVFGNVAITAARKRAQSALPDAPVVPYEASSAPRWRGLAVAFLRSSAQRRVRLADRLDPACA